ncbi:MAG: ribonuclease D [Syntrophobacteraceae bacterium]|nr:ribonuclease D [Syntrophobacteraceae bacterium]
MKPPLLIETTRKLAEILPRLRESRHIAVDTESNSFHAYFERLCLIQISTPEEDYILDPLAIEDLTGLGEVLSDSKIEKIFHAASNDVLGFKRDFQFQVHGLFDTAIAGKLLGCKKLALARMLEDHFGVILDKKWQRCNWARRPLDEEQLDYARLDTHYLIPLRHQMAVELEERNLWDAAAKAFQMVCEQSLQQKVFRPGGYLYIRGARQLDQEGKRVLKALYLYREQEAKKRDIAPFRILSNETLVRLAQCRPASVEDLARIKGVPKVYRHHPSARQLLKRIWNV